jgi:hypothetical protein
MDRTTELVIAAVGGVVVGGLIIHMMRSRGAAVANGNLGPVPQALPTLGPGVTQTSGGGIIIALTSGNATQSLALDVNTSVIVQLPAGASWISVDGSPINDTTSPYGFVFIGGPVTHAFVWVDSTKAQWTATFNLSVAAAVPTTNA